MISSHGEPNTSGRPTHPGRREIRQEGTSETLDSTPSKPVFILSNVLFITLVIFVGHVGLINLYRWGRTPTLTVGALLAGVIVSLLIWQKESRFTPLVVGALLWAVLGEMTDQLGYGDIVSLENGFFLTGLIALVGWLVYKNRLSESLAIAAAFFLAIWACHFVLVNLLERLGGTHPVTVASASLFIAMQALAVLMIRRSESRFALTLCSVLLACGFWSILEYVWAWRAILRPW